MSKHPVTRPVQRAFQLLPQQGEPIPMVVTLYPDASLSIRRKYARTEQCIPLVTPLAPPSQPISDPRPRTRHWSFTDDEESIGTPEASR